MSFYIICDVFTNKTLKLRSLSGDMGDKNYGHDLITCGNNLFNLWARLNILWAQLIYFIGMT